MDEPERKEVIACLETTVAGWLAVHRNVVWSVVQLLLSAGLVAAGVGMEAKGPGSPDWPEVVEVLGVVAVAMSLMIGMAVFIFVRIGLGRPVPPDRLAILSPALSEANRALLVLSAPVWFDDLYNLLLDDSVRQRRQQERDAKDALVAAQVAGLNEKR
jgi:hypothetical protein